MKETQVQSLIVKAVEEAGGAARKLSHRFLVGVSDLLIKLPEEPAVLMEVKLDRRSNMGTRGVPVRPDVTMPQYLFLKDFAAAGMKCGVMSFVEEAHKGKRGLWLQLVPAPPFRPGCGLNVRDYRYIGSQFVEVVQMLREFHNEHHQ